jgi:hypothetical protein
MPNAIITNSFFIIAPYKGGSICAAGPGRPAYADFGAALLVVENVLGAGLANPPDGLPNPLDGLLYPVDGLLYPPTELFPYPEFMPGALTPASFSWVRPNAATPIMAPMAM